MLLNKLRKGAFLVLINTSLSAEAAIILSRSGLHVRTAPEKSAKSLVLAPFGTELKVAEKTKKISKIDGISAPWLKVTFDSYSGWIFAGYTTLLTDSTQSSHPVCTRDIASDPYTFFNTERRDFVDEIFLEIVKEGKNCRFKLNNGPDAFEYSSVSVECSESVCNIRETGKKAASYRLRLIGKRVIILEMTPIVKGDKESYTYTETEPVFPNNTVFIRK